MTKLTWVSKIDFSALSEMTKSVLEGKSLRIGNPLIVMRGLISDANNLCKFVVKQKKVFLRRQEMDSRFHANDRVGGYGLMFANVQTLEQAQAVK